jgi:hypothetical protein
MSALLQITEQGRRTRALRLTFDPPVACPAATAIFETERGSGVRCAIERNTLTAVSDPQSLTGFCFGSGEVVAPDLPSDYKRCPTWIAQKEWIEEGLRTEKVDDKRGMIDTRTYREDLVEMNRDLEVTHFYPDE